MSYPAASLSGHSSGMLEFSGHLTVQLSSSESLSFKMMLLKSGCGAKVPNVQTGVSAAHQDIAGGLWHPSTFPEDSSVPSYDVTVCLSLQSRGVLELHLAMCIKAGHRTGQRSECTTSSLSIRCCNRKMEYYYLFGVCSSQIRIEIEDMKS